MPGVLSNETLRKLYKTQRRWSVVGTINAAANGAISLYMVYTKASAGDYLAYFWAAMLTGFILLGGMSALQWKDAEKRLSTLE